VAAKITYTPTGGAWRSQTVKVNKSAESASAAADGAAPLVFPVGHYMGPFHPTRGAPPKHHIVRVGWDTPKLPDQAHVEIWALAHGLPAQADTVRWTRRAIVETAQDAGMPDAAAILDRLAELGLIAEVGPRTEQTREFAGSYRLQSLLIGLGNTPGDPALEGIGVAGLPPAVNVDPRVFEIWQWAHLWPSVWAACEGLAWVAGQAQGARPDDADPEKLLEVMIGAIRTLIARNAVYLDVAPTPSGESR